jgi:hypothetical protein
MASITLGVASFGKCLGSRRPKDLYPTLHYRPVTTQFAVLKHWQSSAFARMPVFHREFTHQGYRSSGIRKESPADARNHNK